MITSGKYISNEEDLNKAEAMGITDTKPNYQDCEIGFSFKDVLFYKIIEEEDIIIIKFRNGLEEEIVITEENIIILRKFFMNQ